MALKVEVDTEDLPSKGWVITESGLCLPPDHSNTGLVVVDEVLEEGLSDLQRHAHFAVQSGEICTRLANYGMWETGEIGWMQSDEQYPPSRRLGMLVARAEGAWHATYTPELG